MVMLIAITATIILAVDACRDPARTEPGEAEKELGAEPEQYSATIVRTVIDGESRETTFTTEARSGALRREEWTERGKSRALVLRPDLGTSYLLDLDRQEYVEISLGGGGENLGNDSQMRDRASADSTTSLVQAADRAIDDAPSPDRVDSRELSSADVDGHACKVYERRATFVDGHSEIVKTFRAPGLGGLTLRTESYSEPSSVRVITERKDVSIDVAPNAFTVPQSFKKVEKLKP